MGLWIKIIWPWSLNSLMNECQDIHNRSSTTSTISIGTLILKDWNALDGKTVMASKKGVSMTWESPSTERDSLAGSSQRGLRMLECPLALILWVSVLSVVDIKILTNSTHKAKSFQFKKRLKSKKGMPQRKVIIIICMIKINSTQVTPSILLMVKIKSGKLYKTFSLKPTPTLNNWIMEPRNWANPSQT